MSANWIPATAPTIQSARAYFAPVNRQTQTPVIFDPSMQSAFDVDAPPAPWIDLGGIQNFSRTATSKSGNVQTGIPSAVLEQVRESVSAQVSFEFEAWTKLTMALATGAQHMNVLSSASGAGLSATGSQATSAVTMGSGSTSTFLVLSSADAARFSAGQIVAVDADYSGQTGYVGAPIAGAYLRQPVTDIDYIRRITFNIGMIEDVMSAGLQLAYALPGGAPVDGSKIQPVTGFVDREGGCFYQEWSGLFVMTGSQGDRILYYYPRLQTTASAEEFLQSLDEKHKSGYMQVIPRAKFLALPVSDSLDGERVVCYRSYIPAPNARV